MKAAVIKQHSSLKMLQDTPEISFSFENKPIPAPTETQVLVKIKSCGLNHLDTWVRRGVPGHKFPLPMVPGSDITGVVEKTGTNAKKFKAGDKIIVNPALSCGHCEFCNSGRDHICNKWGLLGETTDGGCQEYIAVEENQVHRLPTNLSFEQGACIPVNYVTAWEMLVGKAQIKSGQTILIHAAGSGVSVACIQIAKLFGLEIFVTSTSKEKLERAKILGAHHATTDNFRELIKTQTNKQGVDVVVDHVAGPRFMESIKCLKKGGKLVSCGATAGSDLQIDWKTVFFKNISLLGSTYGGRGQFVEVLKHFELGKLKPIIDSTIKLEELPKAHVALETRKVFGKIVVNF